MADQNQNKTPKPENERPSILRRIAIILGILIGFLIYSYGWTVTEIDLGVPQEAQRQENVQIALRELLSPRILQQERDVTILSAPFLMACDEGESPDQADPSSGDAVVVLDPACGDSGDEITVQVYNGQTNADARVRWMPPPGEGETEEDVRPRPREILETEREELVLNGNGRFTGTIEVPLIRGGDGQLHQVQVQVAVPAGPIQLSETAILVIDRMAQTIFMALVATTVAIPIAVVLSFIAARNLMQRVRLTVGSMLLAFITFVLGIALGNTVLGPLGRLGFTIGRGDIGGDLGALVAFAVPLVWVVGLVYIIRTLNPVRIEKRHVETALWRQTLNTVVIVIGAMFAVGALGGLGLLGGEQVRLLGENLQPEGAVGPSGWLARLPGVLVVAVGNLLTILGTLVELGISLIASLLLGAMFAGISGNLVGTWLRRVPDSLGTALGILLGAISGGILMALMGVFGLWASLLGLLPPLIAAIMGGNLLIIALTTFLPANTARQLRNQEGGPLGDLLRRSYRRLPVGLRRARHRPCPRRRHAPQPNASQLVRHDAPGHPVRV